MTKVERNPESILGWYRNLPGEEKKMILALSVPVISLIIILGAHYLPLVLTGLGRLWWPFLFLEKKPFLRSFLFWDAFIYDAIISRK